MISKKIYFPVLFFSLLTHSFLYAQGISDKTNLIKKNEPIEIVSDRMEAFHEKKMVVFSGNATATQGDIVLKADQLSLYYKNQNGKKDKVGVKEIETTGELERISAKGNVLITQKERAASGDEAVYYHDSSQIVMIGNPVLREGKNTISGCKVIIYLNENRGKVEKCGTEKSERVTAIIHPQGKK